MKQAKGFALVAVLIIMTVMLVLGIGAHYLTQMNLKIAENERSSAMAKHNAEGGLEVAHLALAKTPSLASKGFPTNFALPTMEDGNFRLSSAGGSAGYSAIDSDGDGFNEYATLRVEGYTVSEGAFVKEALFSVEQALPNPLFNGGLVAKGVIRFVTNDIRTNIWSGDYLSSRNQGVFAAGYSGKASRGCDIAVDCDAGPHIPVPDVPKPVFSDLRDQVMANHPECSDPLTALANTVVGTINNPQNQVICVPPGGSLTVTGTAKNVVIIGDETTTVSFDAHSASAATDPADHGVTVVAGTLNMDNTATTLSGTNTFIAKRDIGFAKGVLSNDSTSHTLVVSEEDIKVTGNGGASISHVSFWTGGFFDIAGSSDRIIGTVLAYKNIEIGGRAGQITQGDTDNPYIPRAGDPTIKVESKR